MAIGVGGSHHLLKEAFCRVKITFSREQELDCLIVRIDRIGKDASTHADLHIGFFDAVLDANELQMLAHPLIDLLGIALHPAEHSCAIYGVPRFRIISSRL